MRRNVNAEIPIALDIASVVMTSGSAMNRNQASATPRASPCFSPRPDEHLRPVPAASASTPCACQRGYSNDTLPATSRNLSLSVVIRLWFWTRLTAMG